MELEDEVVFITQQVATRLRVHPAKILKIKGPNSSTSGGNVIVERLDPSVENDQWIIEFFDSKKYNLRNSSGSIDENGSIDDHTPDLGWGYPKFKIETKGIPFAKGDSCKFETFRSSFLKFIHQI